MTSPDPDARPEDSGEAAHGTWPTLAPATFWEERYAGADRVWSGRVNAVLAAVATTLTPGTALDLGCGEGGDVIWLAQHGWYATGIDISQTAIARARRAAQDADLTGRAQFVAGDLSSSDGLQAYDLVTASFLHSPVALAREDILRAAAVLVAADGHLLITSHAAAPPWADASAHHHEFQSPQDELDGLALDPAQWRTVLAETRTRTATGPDGVAATLDDTVVLVRHL